MRSLFFFIVLVLGGGVYGQWPYDFSESSVWIRWDGTGVDSLGLGSAGLKIADFCVWNSGWGGFWYGSKTPPASWGGGVYTVDWLIFSGYVQINVYTNGSKTHETRDNGDPGTLTGVWNQFGDHTGQLPNYQYYLSEIPPASPPPEIPGYDEPLYPGWPVSPPIIVVPPEWVPPSTPESPVSEGETGDTEVWVMNEVEGHSRPDAYKAYGPDEIGKLPSAFPTDDGQQYLPSYRLRETFPEPGYSDPGIVFPLSVLGGGFQDVQLSTVFGEWNNVEVYFEDWRLRINWMLVFSVRLMLIFYCVRLAISIGGAAS